MEESALQRYVLNGGVMMVVLIPTLILMVAFIIQAFLNLRLERIAPRGFADRVWQSRRNGGREAARRELFGARHSLADIIRKVEAHLEFNPGADPAEALREQIIDECDALLQQNSQLADIYRVAPLMGLLGTVFGMIQTFGDFTASATPDVQQLAKGVNVALLTTAWGLSIAIPAYVALALLQRRVAWFEQVVFPREAASALHALLDRPVSTSSGVQQLPQKPGG